MNNTNKQELSRWINVLYNRKQIGDKQNDRRKI